MIKTKIQLNELRFDAKTDIKTFNGFKRVRGQTISFKEYLDNLNLDFNFKYLRIKPIIKHPSKGNPEISKSTREIDCLSFINNDLSPFDKWFYYFEESNPNWLEILKNVEA